MKYYLLLIIFLLPLGVYAHSFQSSENVIIAFYTMPSEPPVPGENTEFTIGVGLTNNPNEFANGSNVNVEFFENGKSVVNKKFTNAQEAISFNYTLKEAVYSLRISAEQGKEYIGENFTKQTKEFVINTIPLDIPKTEPKKDYTQIIVFGGLTLAGILLLLAYLVSNKGRK